MTLETSGAGGLTAVAGSTPRALAVADEPAATGGAQGASPAGSPLRAMTLDEARTWAEAHQPSLAAARARLEAAAADARVPRAQWFPRIAAGLELLGGTTNNSTASTVALAGVDLPRIGATRVPDGPSYAPVPSTLAAVGLRQQVFDFGRIAAQSAFADALEQVEGHRADAERLDVQLTVEEAFYAVKAAHAVTAAAEGAWQRAKVSRDTARAGVSAGLRKPIELTRAEADLSRFEVSVVRARAGLTTAQAVFAAATGTDERLLEAAGEPAPRSEPAQLSEVLRAAAEREPRLRAARATADAQRARTRAISAERRPDLAFTAAFSGRAGGATPSAGPVPYGGGWLPDVPNWDVGLVFSVPLLDVPGLRRTDAAERLEAVRDAELRGVELALAAQVQRAWVDWGSAREAVPALERQLAAAEANWNQARARFDGGLAQALELADAEALRTDAEIQLAVGHFELARTRARLARITAEGATP
ncbi:MAG: TolC family protein [Archangiaceae bacterium]|nr:TolC family protein [Archangiaceae bacterium]